ncbi:PKHA5 protein, partial [Phaetusa simplex]|nr:PKHA5 protein [Phaetusa simplex]
SHNERKVTCKHPVTGQPSQDNCIFVVNEQTAAAMTSEEKKERPISMICEATNYNLTSDYAAHPMSPVGRTSRSSKKVHNFGKRSNSIKRNPNAPVVRRGWLYKQDSTGMKLWKKRWFVLSDLCLFYYRDEKEEGILGSILLPSFQISVLSPEDHINRKYAFKAAHPNMRTYYFCTDTGKEMELWMKAMTDAALVQTEPVKRYCGLTKQCHNVSCVFPKITENKRFQLIERRSDRSNYPNEIRSAMYEFILYMKTLCSLSSITLLMFGNSRSVPPRVLPHKSLHKNWFQIKNFSLEVMIGRNITFSFLLAENIRCIQPLHLMVMYEKKPPRLKIVLMHIAREIIISYQTLPRNMPSHRPQVLPRYPEGYRTLPRNSKARPESLCSVTPSAYDRAIGPVTAEEKRRSMRDDTMWQLYEWQQRQFYNKQTTLSRHSTLSSPKTMINISDQTMHSIPTSPSHGSIAGFQGYSPQRTYRSEVSSPVQRGDVTIDRRHRSHHTKHVFVPDRRSMPAGLSLQPVTPQSLQGKTLTQEECRGTLYKYRTEELDIDAKLSRLCEQDKVVQALEEKLQQLHKEKYTLEQALLSASQEIEMNADNPAAIQNVVLQRDDLQNGLLSTCREVSRATA